LSNLKNPGRLILKKESKITKKRSEGVLGTALEGSGIWAKERENMERYRVRTGSIKKGGS